ncbi:CHAP domain-containing protein [Corticicoccus populi]|uniref:CHAP domain-containing protein n=1 Tax=Corticicoccus populi TaxID=1812821 RepID=A0ABW5WW39_9STAP
MKKIFIYGGILFFITAGILLLNEQSEDGIFNEVKLFFTPDPMSHNTYENGECTYYVFDRVRDDGNKIERRWHDAEKWAERAEADGYIVNDAPKTGSILQTEEGPIGHVAYVERINDDGSVEISEMNLREPYEITERIIEADEIEDYNYIHPKENPHAEKYIEE